MRDGNRPDSRPAGNNILHGSLSREKAWIFQDLFHSARLCAALDGNPPLEMGARAIACPATLDNFTWQTHHGGPFQLSIAARVEVRHGLKPPFIVAVTRLHQQ